MKTYALKVVLDQPAVDQDEADALYAYCKDATLITAEGKTYLEFDRVAPILDDALRSAIADIRAAGFRVDRIEIEAGEFRV